MNQPRKLPAIVCGLSLAVSSLAASAPPVRPVSAPAQPHAVAVSKPTMSAAECVVWDRERSFAASIEHHDAAAFAEHVQERAVFEAGSPAPLHGRNAVVAGWKGIIEGKQSKLGWSPGIVTIGGNGRIAISRGPTWLENLRPDAESRYKIGEFISTWVRDPDGQWRVLFDAATAPLRPATADEVARLVASLPEQCPRR